MNNWSSFDFSIIFSNIFDNFITKNLFVFLQVSFVGDIFTYLSWDLRKFDNRKISKISEKFKRIIQSIGKCQRNHKMIQKMGNLQNNFGHVQEIDKTKYHKNGFSWNCKFQDRIDLVYKRTRHQLKSNLYFSSSLGVGDNLLYAIIFLFSTYFFHPDFELLEKMMQKLA